MPDVVLIPTADGSPSLLNVALNETYHSRHGALQESQHVFIKNGLDYLIERDHPKQIKILEIGFGTGLNALLIPQNQNSNFFKTKSPKIQRFNRR